MARGNQPIPILERVQDGKSCRRAEKGVRSGSRDSTCHPVKPLKYIIYFFTDPAGPVLADG